MSDKTKEPRKTQSPEQPRPRACGCGCIAKGTKAEKLEAKK